MTASWLVLAGVALLLIAASVAVTDRLARSVTRPAADLARTSRDLAGGDTAARAVVAGPPEIAAVAESLNLLADRIDELLRRSASAWPTCPIGSARRSPPCGSTPRGTAPRRWSRTSIAWRPRSPS